MTSLEKSAQPAHELSVELSTRITSQNLHFRSGREEAAVMSIVDVFKATRALMKSHREATEFLRLSDAMLQAIRPYTARWHGLIDAENRFVDPVARRQFRSELLELQPILVTFTECFAAVSRGEAAQIPSVPAAKVPKLGRTIPIGIGQSRSRPDNYSDIDHAEREHLARRRKAPLSTTDAPLVDGAGLALSGGGIRSATFSLGVVQVLAEKRLLPQFDYLSTVSGGGYFGSFLSNQFTDSTPEPGKLGEDFDPRSEESAAIRHLRNSSKYLLPKTTIDRLRLGAILLSGILATTLLTVAIPVAAALLLRIVAHIWGFGENVRNVFLATAAIFGVLAALCWLVRPVRWLARRVRATLDSLAAYFSMIAAAALFVGFTPTMLDWLRNWQQWQVIGFSIGSAATIVSGAAVVKAMKSAWKHRKALSRVFMASGIVLFVIVYLATVSALGLEASGWRLSAAEIVVFGALVLWAAWALSINLNETGLHRYYRDKLAECYLNGQTAARRASNPAALTELSERLPYHLINTTVNLTSSSNAELRGRGGDFFLLSKFYCGSPLMAYKKTAEVTALNNDLDLATAMAISGAAASTNMGWQTMIEYRTLMAIFNVRLGYWLQWQADKSRLRSNAFVQLMREIFGSLNESATGINLSDGGHIENLGVYELIRRKLRFIVCVDGGMDDKMTCSDLNRLQRLVAIDFGYRIEFDPSSLTLTNRFSTDYGTLVKIDYNPDESNPEEKQLGWMLYIKLAMLGIEANYVLDYHRENPMFPHQSTGDQFFDEAQFEAYRKLGESAARNFFSPPFSAPTAEQIQSGVGFEKWFEVLAQHMLRDTDPVFA